MLNRNRIEGLRILARRNTLTQKDWFELLEARRAMIEPHLRDMTLKSLGDLKIVSDDRSKAPYARPLRMGGMENKTYSTPPFKKYRDASELQIAQGPFSLDTRGIWPDDDVYYHGHFKGEHLFEGRPSPATGLITRFWGLTRNNEWLKAEMIERYFEQERHAGHDDREQKRSEVIKFTTWKASPEEICMFCKITPQWMWQRLGDAVEAWLNQRKAQLFASESLVELFNYEKMLLDIVERK